MSEQKMSIDEARNKLSLMQLEYEQMPANAHNRVDREYRCYLENNISMFETAIQKFDEAAGGA